MLCFFVSLFLARVFTGLLKVLKGHTNQDLIQSQKVCAKGLLISKADWRAIDSPKKQTNEFVLFACLLFMANKSNSSDCFLGESTACRTKVNIPCADLLFDSI